MSSDSCDRDQIRRAVQLILAPVWEARRRGRTPVLGTPKGTVSGYFDRDHIEELIEAAVRWSGNADGIYITLNPVRHDCLARAANRAIVYAKHTTCDRATSYRHCGCHKH